MRSFTILLIWSFGLQLAFSQDSEITLMSWNITDFGQTKKDIEIERIANILKGADIIALQEVVAGEGGEDAVLRLVESLNFKGSKWDFQISEGTSFPSGASEKYAFLWKVDRISYARRGRLLKDLQHMMYREPFLVHFYIEGRRFTVANFHARPENCTEEEVWALVTYLNAHYDNLILAGDFNLKFDSDAFQGFKKARFKAVIHSELTTIKTKCDENGAYLNESYDNIIYPGYLSVIESGAIDYVKSCDQVELAYHISNHLPLIIKFNPTN